MTQQYGNNNGHKNNGKKKYAHAGQPEKYTQEFLEKEAEALIAYGKEAKLPFLKEFCCLREYPSCLIDGFAMKSEKFLLALNRFKDYQESKIVLKALVKQIDGWFAYQTLKNVAGWRDKFEIEGTVNFTLEKFLENVNRKTARSGEAMARLSNN